MSKAIPAPLVAAVHDLSGVGRCSLGVILPVLSVMGCQCAPMPTALLSASTLFPPSPRFLFRDLTGEMETTAGHWAQLGLSFDAVYTGFVGSLEQLSVLERALDTLAGPDTLILVDPVMGDHGKPYRTYTPAMCRAMGELARRAHIITPNLTEAALLLGEDPAALPQDPARLRQWLERLSLDGARSVVLTGVRPGPGRVGAACFDRETGALSFPCAPEAPASFPGTGDLFAAVTLGGLLGGEALEPAVQRAADFVSGCIRETLALGTDPAFGVEFEKQLGKLKIKN